jgi:hypothetical protein
MPRSRLAPAQSPHSAPPAALEQVLQRLGRHIHTARLRRRWRLEDGAERLGVNRSTVPVVERGGPGTSIAADLGALWACSISWRRWPIPTGMGRARPWRRPANRARLQAAIASTTTSGPPGPATSSSPGARPSSDRISRASLTWSLRAARSSSGRAGLRRALIGGANRWARSSMAPATGSEPTRWSWIPCSPMLAASTDPPCRGIGLVHPTTRPGRARTGTGAPRCFCGHRLCRAPWKSQTAASPAVRRSSPRHGPSGTTPAAGSP